jgi:hypothetical protein
LAKSEIRKEGKNAVSSLTDKGTDAFDANRKKIQQNTDQISAEKTLNSVEFKRIKESQASNSAAIKTNSEHISFINKANNEGLS